MLLNYLKLSVRLMIRNPFFTIINVTGLAIGLVVFFLLWRYSQSELNADRFHKDSDRIYWLTFQRAAEDGESEGMPFTHPPYAPALKEAFPEIEEYCRYVSQNAFENLHGIGHGAKIFFSKRTTTARTDFFEDRVIYADENFFRFYTFPLLSGSPDRVLSDVNGITLSRSMAKKYFGEDEAMGKTLYMNDSIPFIVSGVFEDVPRNSVFEFDAVLSMRRIAHVIEPMEPLQWSSYTCFRLKSGIDVAKFLPRLNTGFQKRFKGLIDKYWPSNTFGVTLLPIPDAVQFHPSRARIIAQVLGGVSILVLVMAWINYINLVSSMSSRRAVEYTARQAIGARPADIVKQFIVEAVVINVLSALLATTIIQFFKSPFELWMGFYSPDISSMTLPTLLILWSVWVLGVFITGVYPAWTILRRNGRASSGLKPLASLESEYGLPAVLKVFQYSAAVAFMVWVFLAYEQLDFILNKDIGLNSKEVVAVDLPDEGKSLSVDAVEAFLNSLRSRSHIEGATVSHIVLGQWSNSHVTVKTSHSAPMLSASCSGGVDEHFIPFYGIKILHGRNFERGRKSDESAIIISERFAVRLGFHDPAEALGRKILIEPAETSLDKMVYADVIGIMSDHIVTPLFSFLAQLTTEGNALTYWDNLVSYQPPKYISLRLNMRNFQEAIRDVEELYSKHFNGMPCHWSFLDEGMQKTYENQSRLRNQILFFSCIAVLIACLGMLGIVSNKAVEKTKEIGIRKVMGATLDQIARLLLHTTARQVVIGVALGLPAAFFLTQPFLESFAERIEIQWWHFALPVLFLLIIMFGTVASEVWKAARRNPVDALKYE